MSPRRHSTTFLVPIGVLVAVAAFGVLVVGLRHGTAGGLAPEAAVGAPALSPSPTPSAGPRWLVAETRTTTVVYRRPSSSAQTLATLPRLNAHGCVTVMLVRRAATVAGATWYQVWLPRRPNFSSGWVSAAGVGTYSTPAEIVIDLSERRLTVFRDGRSEGRFSVAVGSAAYPTPPGLFFVAEKTTPIPGGPYGVLALGLSGYQPRLPSLGALAIHGTDDVALIGKAVSDGCIRMSNADVLKVSRWVPTGSPVLIRQ